MAQITIISNRLPFSVSKVDDELVFQPSTGGIATGLASYISNRRNTWIGWPGIASDELTEEDKQAITLEMGRQNCVPVFLNKRQLDNFYNGYSNSVLWPLLHNLPWKKVPANHDTWWKAYREVNKAYAEVVLGVSPPGSIVWVHDYLLLLLPELLRAEQPGDNLGFFLHIPFPEPKVFKRLPEAKRLLKGILGADLVGLHTATYVKNFLDTCEQLQIGLPSPGQVILGGRTVRVTDFPMGIDYEKFAQANKLPAVKIAVKQYKRRYRGRKLIVAIDRLDISKGLVERLQAYQTLLQQNLRLHGKIIFCMVAAPSRTEIKAYQDLKIRLEKLITDINTTHGTSNWQPIDYIGVSIPFEEVTALFQIADVAFIAPIRDGMNLAAKEFVASNRRRGVLILSETAGAAEELRDALLVDPQQPDAMVEALQQALTMPRRELRARLRTMQWQLANNTVHTWAKSFVDTLQQPLSSVPRTRLLRASLQHQLVVDYRTSRRRLLLLDYDGSLAPFTEDFKDAQPSQSLLRLLKTLLKTDGNEVVIISGRSADDLDAWFGQLSVNLVAEHGALVKKIGDTSWQALVHSETKWRRSIEPILDKYAALTPRARVEVKPHSLVWHYRSSPSYYAQKYVVILKRILKPLLKTYGLQIYQGNKILEIKDPRVNKGNAAQRWLKNNYDFVLAIGDDFTDEELFAVLPESAYSVKVGPGHSIAVFRLRTVRDVITLLKQLTKK